VHCVTEAFQKHVALNPKLSGENEMLGVGWLSHQRSHGVDDISSPVVDMLLVIDIPSDVLKSVLFPLGQIMIIFRVSRERQDCIPVVEASETQSCAFVIQHVVIVRLHAMLLNPSMDICVLIMGRKRVEGIVLRVRLKAALSVVFPWLCKIINQGSAGTVEYFRLRQRWH
jgi:hypothetical protein